MQNIVNPEDINHDGYATALDALGVINELNGEGEEDQGISSDVNGDGVVSPGDALYVINRINAASEKSSVPVETRIANLEKALAAGKVPNRYSVDTAREILATLKNGGLPELGDRFRNGQMINLHNLGENLAGAGTETQAAQPAPAPTTGVSQPKPIPTPIELEPLDSGSSEDPLELDEALEDGSPGGVDWWNDVVEDLSAFDDASLDGYIRPWLIDGLQGIGSDPSLHDSLYQEQINHWITALENDESIPMDILLDIQAYTSTLGDLRAQIEQMFANFDLDAIMDNLPSFEIIVEAITPEATIPEYGDEYEEAMAEWAAGDHFLLIF